MEAYDVAALVLRVVLGGVMLAHGVKHAKGRTKTSTWFGSIGFKAPGLQWFASTATEIGVGVLLIAGLLTTAAAAGVIGVMTVAFVSVHRAAGFWVTARPDEGWEYVLSLSAIAAALAIGGPGGYSIDAAIGLDTILTGWVGAVAIFGGLVAAGAQLATFFKPDLTPDTQR
ncbi:MAG: DoxX family protein [Actinomycetota bacterium]